MAWMLPASLLISLGGCAASIETTAQMPPLPEQLEGCFGPLTNLPGGDWSIQETVSVVAALRRSEIRRTECGNQLVTFYNGVRSANSGEVQ